MPSISRDKEQLYYCDSCKATGTRKVFEWYKDTSRPFLIHRCAYGGPAYAYRLGEREEIFKSVEKPKPKPKKKAAITESSYERFLRHLEQDDYV